MSLLKHRCIGYVRSRPRLPADEQIEDAFESGCNLVYVDLGRGRMRVVDAAGEGPELKRDARAEWIKALGVGRDTVAWVHRLDVLLRSKAELTGAQPSRDVAAILSATAAKAHALVEGSTGTTSDLSADWQARVAWVMSRAVGGTAKDIERQREHGRKGAKAAKAKSPVRRWKRKSMREQFDAAARIWRDPIYRTREEARAALPEELRSLSVVTLWRLFRGRTVKR